MEVIQVWFNGSIGINRNWGMVILGKITTGVGCILGWKRIPEVHIVLESCRPKRKIDSGRPMVLGM